jgi:phospholipid/cholesterol/gamma-HCH transport system ATP-binding protein
LFSTALVSRSDEARQKIVLGGSGSGKSTIINLILGLIKPDSGQVLIDGEDVTPYDELQMMSVRKKIGMVFQEGALFDSLPVYDNVAYRLHEEGVDEDEVDHEVHRMLHFVNLEDAVDKMPAELSGGMRRRVGIARALVGNPSIVLFDEPTAGLDPPTARTICELAIKLRDLEDVSSIFVTHEMNNVEYLTSEYAIVDENGRVLFEREGEKFCLINTEVIMLREGHIIFSGKGRATQSVERSVYPQVHSREIKQMPRSQTSISYSQLRVGLFVLADCLSWVFSFLIRAAILTRSRRGCT